MLTADLVRTRKNKGVLHIVALKDRARAVELASEFIEIAQFHVGESREDFERSNAVVKYEVSEQRVAAAFRKLVEDRCDFGGDDEDRAEEIRRAVFLRSSREREGEAWERTGVLEGAAQDLSMSVGAVEKGMYGDLRGAQLLRRVEPVFAEDLVDGFDLAQVQAVLLRASHVSVRVKLGSPMAMRGLIRRVKFLQLLCEIFNEDAGVRIEVNGPFSLFSSVTKYGLKLAMLVPLLREFGSWELEARVRWGAKREDLVFRYEHEGIGPGRTRSTGAATRPTAPAYTEFEMPEIERFVGSFRELESNWKVIACTEILSIPGAGVCVPDLIFERETGEQVYFELMGYWSRAAVWKRVELVQAGLRQKVLFAVSDRLRVSEDVLGEGELGGLVVFKGVIRARAVLEKLEVNFGTGSRQGWGHPLRF